MDGADVRLDRPAAPVVRKNTRPEGISAGLVCLCVSVCVALFLQSHVLHRYCIHLDILCIKVHVQQEITEPEKAQSKYILISAAHTVYETVPSPHSKTNALSPAPPPPPPPSLWSRNTLIPHKKWTIPPPNTTAFLFQFSFKCTNAPSPLHLLSSILTSSASPSLFLNPPPAPHQLQTTSVGAKQSQQWLDPGTYERSSLISFGQEQHKGSNQRHKLNQRWGFYCVCWHVCDVVLFLWPVKLSSWKKKKMKSIFFILFTPLCYVVFPCVLL